MCRLPLSSTTIVADGMRHAATAAEGVDGMTLSWRPRAEVVSAQAFLQSKWIGPTRSRCGACNRVAAAARRVRVLSRPRAAVQLGDQLDYSAAFKNESGQRVEVL